MNSTSIKTVHYVKRGLISDEDFITGNYALAYVMCLVSMVGVVTNSINIKTFISMGLEDGITVSLMGLSISDFGFTFFGFILGSSNIIDTIELTHGLTSLPIQPRLVFGMFSANLAYICYQVTCMITTFMAVARCMCVAMPFQFKNYFTQSKSVVALVLFTLIAVASYVPLLAQMGVRRKYDPAVNKTRLVLWNSSRRSDVKDAVSLIHFIVFVFISSFIVVVCVVIMAKYLRLSVTFRQMSSTGNFGDDQKETSRYKLSGKELQVLRQVIVICIIYTGCMLPTVVYGVYRLMEEEFDVGKRLNNLCFLTGTIGIILELVNSASTFPVYYAYNSKFRSHCFSSGRTSEKKN